MDKRIFLSLLAVMVLVASAVTAQTSGGVVVTTSPPGAEVVLRGEAVVSGVSPAFFQQGLTGAYKVEIRRHGYENYATQIVLDPTRQFDLDINLSPKTRLKAAARSLFIPGWGQKYSGQKTKALTFQLAIVGAGLAFLMANDDFNDKRDDLRDIENRFQEAGDYQTQQRLYDDIVVAQRDAYDAENSRRVTMGLGIGIWALNVLDAFIFFPENRESFSVKGITINPDTSGNRIGLAVSTQF